MFIPLGTDRPRKRPTVVTYWLMGLSVAVFLAQMVLDRANPELVRRFVDPLVLDPAALQWWQFLTYQFLHGGMMHLLGNMLFLFVFGPCVEDRFRRLGFLGFYLAGGAIAAGAHLFFGAERYEGLLLPAAKVVGASGSIAAVAGAFLVLFPLTGVRVLWFFFVIGAFTIPAWWFIGFCIAKDLLFEGLGAEGVAYLAHLGGYAFGAAVAMVLLWTKVLAREPYDLFSISRQAKRRREFKELSSKGAAPWRKDAARGVAAGELSAEDAKLAERRAEVSHLLASNRQAEAVEKFTALLADHPETVLSRAAHLELANHTFAAGQHRAAATAYERFVARNPTDRETPGIRLMLAVLHARYLGDAARARQVLGEVDEGKLNPEQVELARGLRDELAG